MKATINDFFGSNLEQEVLDEVVIFQAIGNAERPVSVTLPSGKWSDGIELVLCGGFTTSIQSVNYATLNQVELSQATWQVRARFSDEITPHGVTLAKSSDTTANLFYESAVSAVKSITLRKKRISRVGIDELMSAMSLPNLIANADLTDNPINQRGFNGNWSSLAIGAYGYDQWMKVSSTHMGYVVEAGKYRPSTKHTLTKDDVVIGEFMSPASGHWIVSVPFATSGRFDLYAGQFKRPWHPVQNGLEMCQRHYTDLAGRTPFWGAHEGNYTVKVSFRDFPTTMRKAPSCQAFISDGGAASINSIQTTANDVRVTLTNCAAQSTPTLNRVISDASITLAEVNGQITTIG